MDEPDSPSLNSLNYSIIENSVDEHNSIKLKLRISNRQPTVVLEPINQNIMNNLLHIDEESATPSRRSLRPRQIETTKDDTRLRRSLRRNPKVSYNEYISPRKSQRSNDIEEIVNTTPKKKVNIGSDHRLRHTEDLVSPSTLGFEHVNISTPVKAATITGANNAKRRMSTRKSRPINTEQDHDDLEELLTPMVNIRFTDSESIASPRRSKASAKTPINPMKMLRNGEITPTMHNRMSKVMKPATPLNIVKEKLHVSYVPKFLPCREKEYANIYNFVESKLLDGCGGCMYISGVPGTGKTATVSETIRQLQASAKSRTIPTFTYVSINGMRLTEPRQAYVEILKQLTGKTFAWEQAHNTLESRFTKETATKKREDPIVLLVDELDILCTKRQDVVYNLLDWPSKAKAQLIVITIANTMDLPERLLMGRVTSRLGLTRVTFQAYTHKQLQEIVMKRLLGTNAFNPDAVQLVARKVASVSGDARRALDICRRAAEMAEIEGDHVLVSMKHVDDALNSMITQPKVRAIKRCSRLEQLLLQAIAAEVERTGVDETTFSDVYIMLASVASIDGFPMVSITLALSAVKYLSACRLLLSDSKSSDLNLRIILNVSADDIYYALRK